MMKTDALKKIIGGFSSCRIAVIGDLMLDSYLWGRVDRISPEAPVPIVQVMRQNDCPGGAANVMRNIASLGGHVYAFGVVGADESGSLLCQQLEECGVDTQWILEDPSRPTTRKQRVISGSQQLLRIDYEEWRPVNEALRQQLLRGIEQLLESGQVDAVVLEDYAKGLFSAAFAQEIIDMAGRKNVLTTLDPNPRNPMFLEGLTIMKPNRNEAFALAGKPQPPEDAPREEQLEALKIVAGILQSHYAVRYLLISLASEGMALFDENKNCTLIPTRAREVYDVSGAGDTVIAAATLALSTGCQAVEAAEIANHAAGVVVGKLGTVTVGADEVLDSISGELQI